MVQGGRYTSKDVLEVTKQSTDDARVKRFRVSNEGNEVYARAVMYEME